MGALYCRKGVWPQNLIDGGSHQGLHNIRPKYPVLGLIANLPIVADQPGATFGKPPFNQGPDLWMDGNNAVLTGFRFGAALHRAFLQVYIFRFQVQKFRDTPPRI